MKLTKAIANCVAKTAMHAAVKSAGAASWSNTYQAKEPKCLKELSKKH
nr:cyclic lactone autoinducer peptide [uncultured Ruminococcus sp.]